LFKALFILFFFFIFRLAEIEFALKSVLVNVEYT